MTPIHLLIALAILIAGAVFLFRYDIQVASRGDRPAVYRLDRITGEIGYCYNGSCWVQKWK